MNRLVALVLTCVVASLATIVAQQSPAPGEFRFERRIRTGGTGARRLAVDVPLLAGTRSIRMASGDARLPDLRLFDRDGRELQYVLVSNPPADPVWALASTLAVAPVESQTQKTSGFEADLGEALMVDRLRLDDIRSPFLKRLRVEGSGDRSRWTLLVDEGTVFDLPDERLRQTELSFAPGSYRYLRVTWDDTRSGRIPQPRRVAARRVPTAIAPPPLTASLPFERRAGEPGRSRFRVRLPAVRLPIVALDLDVSGSRVLRDATVFEGRLSGTEVVPTRLGGATLKRIEQGDAAATALRVPIDQPLESQLDLVIDDGNNPPIDLRAVTAVFAEQPWIYFESTGDEAVARYGHPSLKAPRYDLEAARQTLKINETPDAAWEEPQARTSTSNVPPPPLPTVGSSLDVSQFRHVRPIPPGDAGLVMLALDAATLAHSRGTQFPDVRIVDAGGRQVPYLVEHASEPLSLDLSIVKSSSRPPALPVDRRASVYRLTWPFEHLPMPRLVLTTSARVFTRPISIAVEREPNRTMRDPWLEMLASASWTHAEQDLPAPPLTLALGTVSAKEILVIVDDGDNSPLPLTSARLLLPSYRLRLFREKDAVLRLAYGRDDLSPPKYDLALLSPQLLGVAATEIVPGPEPTASATASTALVSPRLFWGILIVAVLVLLTLIVRLVKKTDA